MFYERYKMLCTHNGISPSKASEEIGFSKGLVSHWHKNYKQGIDTPPGMEIAKMIAEYFEVSLDYLLGHNAVDPLQELGKKHTSGLTLRDTTPITLRPRPTLTDHEILLIDAYRQHPELQALVNQALGIPDPNEEEGEKA
ncbi:MAG: helix-turn-helix transcriptional regulator [Clostridia bacterium]|nr:helix-turn-helix transcriptional regulator [Clostridia bacterium]